ncbi:CD63 antigen-like [Zootermopsis nevadensis]|uniref:CD63 antigen-like n=1 Tax=Zootermopsis nevadensis TaxID=136037 RepID=UPI000B8E566C|nr:CD63 antigen-like [Zootermopsis nevadensis]
MACSTRCLKFVVFTFIVVFAVSGVAVMIISVANLVHFYSHNDFVPSNVSVPVLLIALTGLGSCLVAALGWRGTMAGNTCHLYMFSFLLITVIMIEFGSAIWGLTSRANFEDEMTKAMEESFSSYAKDKAVADEWKSLQKALECCGIDGPNDYRRFGVVDWSCCLSETQREGSCHVMKQQGCLVSLTRDFQKRLLWVSLLSIAAAVMQMPGVFCTCCLSNSLRNVQRRNRIRDRMLLEVKS